MCVRTYMYDSISLSMQVFPARKSSDGSRFETIFMADVKSCFSPKRGKFATRSVLLTRLRMSVTKRFYK